MEEIVDVLSRCKPAWKRRYSFVLKPRNIDLLLSKNHFSNFISSTRFANDDEEFYQIHVVSHLCLRSQPLKIKFSAKHRDEDLERKATV